MEFSVRPILHDIQQAGGDAVQFSRSLKQNGQFRRLYNRGKSAADRNLVIYCRPNGTRENQIGLTVSTKLGCAVVRNRMRRRLRECYRLNESRFRPGFNMVIVARGRAIGSQFADLEKSLLRLAEKLDLLADPGKPSTNGGGKADARHSAAADPVLP